MKKIISIVTPFFNEEDLILTYYREMVSVFSRIKDYDFELICVDDGSVDETLNILIRISIDDRRVRVIELSRNFGKEAALTAGIDSAIGDAVIPIDADLQDPPELIISMVQEWSKGAEIVLAVSYTHLTLPTKRIV